MDDPNDAARYAKMPSANASQSRLALSKSCRFLDK